MRWARIPVFLGQEGDSSPGKKLGLETIQQTDHGMEKRFFVNGILGGVLSLGLLAAQTSFGQNVLQFNGVNVTSEKAIQLHWLSNPNEIYEIDCANQLNGNADGSTAWQTLYEDYPSQGTNTSWLDTGNYFADPVILHPSQMPMRFYRVVLTGTNTTGYRADGFNYFSHE